MTNIEHLTQEQLTQLANSSKKNESMQDMSHFLECLTCQKKVMEIRGFIADLKQGMRFSSEDVVKPNHLSDQQVNDYVYDIVDLPERNKIIEHISECSSCSKAVLRLKTHRTHQQSSFTEINNTEMDGPTVTLLDSLAEHRGNKKAKIAVRSPLIPYSIAASLLLISLSFYLYSVSDSNHSNLQPDLPFKNDIATSNKESQPDKLRSLDSASNSNEDNLLANLTGFQKVKQGSINWYKGYVETVAIGTADMKKMANPIQAEIVAEKTARHIAYAQLAEMLAGVKVTQNTTYQDLLVVNDQLTIDNERFIQGAIVTDKSFEWIKGSPKATVTMRLPLQGQKSLQSTIDEHMPRVHSRNSDNMFVNQSEKEGIFKAAYTGLLLNLKDASIDPALYLDINIDNTLTDRYAALYYASLDQAKSNHVIGGNPYIVKANVNKLSGEIQINPDDIDLVSQLLSVNQDWTNPNIAVLY